MDSFDLIGTLSDYAATNSWVFLYGDDAMTNYEATKKSIADDQLILSCYPFLAAPVFTNNNKLIQITYSGIVMLGRKFESVEGTTSNLDETHIQKYTRRLKELSQTLSTNLTLFACDNELDLINIQFELSINKFDENIDFVAATVSFVQDAR